MMLKMATCLVCKYKCSNMFISLMVHGSVPGKRWVANVCNKASIDIVIRYDIFIQQQAYTMLYTNKAKYIIMLEVPHIHHVAVYL